MALLVVVVVFLFLVLNWYVAPTKPGERKDLVLALAQILAGTVLLSGLYFTWRTLQVNREGQITERFTRSIDQLGSKELGIRLGGIYALERIARDSEQDHWPIMEVLTAHVRQYAPSLPDEAQQGEEDHGVEKSEEDPGATRQKSEPSEVPAPAPDIQAIITVLRRRTRSLGHGEPEPLDLHETSLSQAKLAEANLSGANLSGADLSGADLRGARLSSVHLEYYVEARIWSSQSWSISWTTNLSGANLSGASIWSAHLSGANLSGADLTEANLFATNLSGAELSGAELWEADLTEADLSGAKLTQEQLEGTIGDDNTKLPSDLKPPRALGREGQRTYRGGMSELAYFRELWIARL